MCVWFQLLISTLKILDKEFLKDTIIITYLHNENFKRQIPDFLFLAPNVSERPRKKVIWNGLLIFLVNNNEVGKRKNKRIGRFGTRVFECLRVSPRGLKKKLYRVANWYFSLIIGKLGSEKTRGLDDLERHFWAH